jgi:hypothetical protein
MYKINTKKTKLVDLYYNDLHGLKTTLNEVRRTGSKYSTNFEYNRKNIDLDLKYTLIMIFNMILHHKKKVDIKNLIVEIKLELSNIDERFEYL